MAIKRAKWFCKNLDKTTKIFCVGRDIHKGFVNNKEFWNTTKPFLTNKGFLTSDGISLTQENETETDKKIAHSFSEKTSGKAPKIEGNPNDQTFNMFTVYN